ncbi:MAG TPA: phosphomannomutase/phosphoglucomutase [bacterium]|nr:phosphomannomutase/phosphoglucomutase [bacterium]
MLNPFIFREYDIRGLAEKDFPDDAAYYIGRGFASLISKKGIGEMVLGQDARISSPRISGHFKKGLMDSGIRVLDIGIVPTPVFYFAGHHYKKRAGACITASHNPKEYNGMKFTIDFSSIYGEQIKEIYRLIQKKDFVSGKGSEESTDAVSVYRAFLKKDIKVNRKLKVVLDAGNGVGGEVFLPVLKEWGFDVFPLFCEVDGNFPNHHPDPTVPDNLKDAIAEVKKQKADVGIAFDGDADRIGVIDEKGSIIWGDRLLIYFSKYLLNEHPHGKVVFEVKCSQSLPEMVEKFGGKPIMWRTGHSHIEEKIKNEKAILGGEMSGHIYFNDRYFGFDDAIYSAARLLEILSRENKTISEVLEDVPGLPITPEIRVDCPDEIKFKVVEELTGIFKKRQKVIDLDGARIVYPEGWGLVRASNTQPVLVLRFEANTEKALQEIKKEVENILSEVISRYE